MTGIVNSTGARSGVIGTTVGTPSGGGVLTEVWYDSDPVPWSGSVTADTWYDSPLSITTATPSSVTSRYAIQGHFQIIDNTNAVAVRILRGTTEVSTMVGNDTGSNHQRVTVAGSHQGADTNQRNNLAFTVYDDPDSTTALTYKLQYMMEGTTAYINRNATWTDNAITYSGIGICTLIVYEITS